MTSTSAERVARGAAYMDENYPGWERRVDLSILDINNPTSCICGQVVSLGQCGGWSLVSDDIQEKYHVQETEFGFTLGRDGDAWVELIKERFNLGILSDLGK